MVAIKSTLAGLVMASLAASVAADTCKAIGSISRGATLSSGFIVKKGDKTICRFDSDLKCGSLPNGNENVIKKCGDLAHAVSFHADCPNYKFDGCTVDFGDDKGVKGETDNHSHASGCDVEFKC